jgi:hypothetical protein
MPPHDTRPELSPLGVASALIGAAGITGCIALLYQAMATIMATEGGFVAAGGPYEIVHPAPDWVWLVPVSIMGMFAFGGLNTWASTRGWGVNAILFAWMGLFIALGWNFLRLGLFDQPDGLRGAWGWVLSGVVFWAMGLAPAVGLIRWVREGWREIRARQAYQAPSAFGLPTDTDTTCAYVLAQLAGVAAGVAGAIALFGAVAG